MNQFTLKNEVRLDLLHYPLTFFVRNLSTGKQRSKLNAVGLGKANYQMLRFCTNGILALPETHKKNSTSP